jgi:uncharacterized protein YeaO (DUF488 family)
VPVRIVRLGSPREADEGLRIGTVRRPPRGVPKERFAADNWYDVWFPNLAPSADLMKMGQSATSDAAWQAREKYRAEMSAADASRILICWPRCSTARFSVGCYCDNEPDAIARCRGSLAERGANIA